MSGIADEVLSHAMDGGLPKFLREADSPIGQCPPPLPRSWPRARALQGWLVSPRVIAAVTVACAGVGLASAALFADGGWHADAVPAPQRASRPNYEVLDALEVVALLKSRLMFAQRIPGIFDAGPVYGGNSNVALPEQADRTAPVHEPDTVGALVLHHLPDSATLTEGAAMGPGTWAMAAGSPDQLMTSLDEGFDQPVTADVDLISRAGLPLGSLKVQLHKPATADAGKAGKIAAADTGEADARPIKRKRLVQRSYRSARADRPVRKRIRRNDALDAQRMTAGAKTQPEDEAAANTDAAGEQKPSGTLSKFFAWLKSGSSKSNKSAAEPISEPQDGASDTDIRRGLGMNAAE